MSFTLPTKQVKDKQWVRDAFFIPRLSTNSNAHAKRAYDSSLHSFYDTTVGGNRALNPVPGFTPFSDPRPNRVNGRPNHNWLNGLGSLYSEAIDQNMETLSLQFGVPKFNALSTFLSNYYDDSAGQMVKSGGIIKNFMFTAGKVAGTLLTLPFQAFFGLNSLYNRVVSAGTGTPYSKFYYMNPTMPLYFNTVQTLVNQLAANMFMAPSANKTNVPDVNSMNEGGPRYVGLDNGGDFKMLKKILPDVFDDNGTVNVFAISTRSQRLANAYNEYVSKTISESGSVEEVKNKLTLINEAGVESQASPQKSFDAYLASYLSAHPSAKEVVKNNDEFDPDKDVIPEITDPSLDVSSAVRNNETGFFDFYNAERKDGAAFITLRTSKQDGGSDSFSNTSKKIPLEEQMNGLSDKARTWSIALSGGNISDNFIVNSVESVVGAIGSALAGGLSSVGFSGAVGLARGAKVEMPEIYDDSNMEYGTKSFTIKLHSPYGNKVSIFMNIFVPLCFILAGVLPRATGKASHMSPFLCRAYAPGKLDSKLCMIESVNISKFTGAIGKSIDNLPTQMDVTVNIKNLDATVTAPVSDSLFGEAISFSAFDEDTALTDYLSSLSGLSLYDSYYFVNRLDLAWRKTVNNWSTLVSPASLSSYVGGTLPGKVISTLSSPGSVI